MKYSSKVALLGGVIDYAGTFPPAALSLEKALRRAATFRSEGKHPWLMGKVALPLVDIKKLTTRLLFESGANGAAWIFTALGSPAQGNGPADFQRAVEWDLRELGHWRDRSAESPFRLSIVGYEMKVPDGAEGVLPAVLDRLAELAPDVTPFFEMGAGDAGKARLDRAAGALAAWADEHPKAAVPGIKIRTGGQSVPSTEDVADAIMAGSGRGLRFKATQGLHEAITHGESLGFVNLFATLAFAYAFEKEKFGKRQAVDCLGAPAKELILSEALSWREFTLSAEEIEAARRRHGAAFGSCSVDEPDESLAKEFP